MRMMSGIRWCGFQNQRDWVPVLAVWSQVNCLTSLSLNFVICKIVIRAVSGLLGELLHVKHRAEHCLPHIHVHLESRHMTLLRNRVFADGIKLGEVMLDWNGPQSNMTDVPVRRGNFGQRHRHRKKKKSTWRHRQRLEQSVHKPKNSQDCQQPPKTGEARKDSSLEPWEETRLDQHASHFQNCEKMNFCCSTIQFVAVCYSSHRKQIHSIIK